MAFFHPARAESSKWSKADGLGAPDVRERVGESGESDREWSACVRIDVPSGTRRRAAECKHDKHLLPSQKASTSDSDGRVSGEAVEADRARHPPTPARGGEAGEAAAGWWHPATVCREASEAVRHRVHTVHATVTRPLRRRGSEADEADRARRPPAPARGAEADEADRARHPPAPARGEAAEAAWRRGRAAPSPPVGVRGVLLLRDTA